MGKCIYCNSSGYGGGCVGSPRHIHEHADDASKCGFCGSTSHGFGCPNSGSINRHKHGHDGVHCVWCGRDAGGTDGMCNISPSHRHER